MRKITNYLYYHVATCIISNKNFVSRSVSFCLLLLLITFTNLGCKKKEDAACGCDSEAIAEIGQVSGKLSYKKQLEPADNFYNNRYWVGEFAYGMSFSYIICNESLLTSEMKNLKSSSGETTLKVKFSGKVRSLCQPTMNPSEVTIQHITLTQIELN
ncbi:hypothetical protein [Desertivirga arenae]|uniref:hypothetical protein n=1 Tax=Desertivirga arenae TaxID=2810309 RepID=UPI001A9673D5|nr:hypothetical protein [Pedobacter sp. SYSU D00823]